MKAHEMVKVQDPVAGSFVKGNEVSDVIKEDKFLE
jgi:hypothetical protein